MRQTYRHQRNLGQNKIFCWPQVCLLFPYSQKGWQKSIWIVPFSRLPFWLLVFASKTDHQRHPASQGSRSFCEERVVILSKCMASCHSETGNVTTSSWQTIVLCKKCPIISDDVWDISKNNRFPQCHILLYRWAFSLSLVKLLLSKPHSDRAAFWLLSAKINSFTVWLSTNIMLGHSKHSHKIMLLSVPKRWSFIVKKVCDITSKQKIMVK